MSDFETWIFSVSRSVPRVRRTIQQTDEWMPLLFSRGCDGKRVKGHQGQVGATYISSLYKSSSSFAVEKKETFRIVQLDDDSITILFQPDRSDRFWLTFPAKTKFRVTEDKELEGIPITLTWKESGNHSTELSLREPKLPSFQCGLSQCLLATVTFGVLFCDNYQPRKRKQHRDDCHEELQIFLSH